MSRRSSGVLGVAAGIHFLHDGFSDILLVLFPLLSAELGLSFTQVGLLRTAYSGGMAAFQLPAGILSERWGEARLLAAGTAVTALGFLAAGMAGGFAGLLACLLVAGLGSGVQHPLSSSLVSMAYETGARRAALGTYNFSGDLGKVAVPAAVAFAASLWGWRAPAATYGALGLVAAAAVLPALARLGVGTVPGPAPGRAGETSAAPGWGIRDGRGFAALSVIHVVDSGTRSAFLTFLPFLLVARGSSVATVGLALMLVFVGGAAGKLACGFLADRVGVIRTVVVTEIATGAGILLLLSLPLAGCLAMLLPLGVALNGTSSVLYGTVADLVRTDRRSRAYALFYTAGIGASAAAPSLYGALSDAVGVATALATVGGMVLVTVPLTMLLRATATPARATGGAS